MLTGATGGIFPGRFLPFHAFAGGSPRVSRATLGLIGEGTLPEAVVPLPDGRRIPVDMRGSGAGAQVIINVNNQTGLPMALKQVGQRQDQGRQIIDVVMTHLYTDPDFRSAIAGAR
jgi:hypothetical protein